MKTFNISNLVITFISVLFFTGCDFSYTNERHANIINWFKYDNFWDLPNDFNEAIKYIEANEDWKMSESAYRKVIVSFPESFEYDFTKHSSAPEYYSSPDGKFRIYNFFRGAKSSNVEILQFKNTKGEVINKTITAYPLHKILKDSVPEEIDYKCGRFNSSSMVKIIGQININQIPTYLCIIKPEDMDPDFYYREEAYEADGADAYIGGLQLTDYDYKFVPIFENNSSSIVRFEQDDNTPYLIISGKIKELTKPNPLGGYDKDSQVLYVPKYVNHSFVQYESFKWNGKFQRFVSLGVDGLFRKDIKYNMFKCPIGWED